MKKLLLGISLLGTLQQVMAQEKPLDVSAYRLYKDMAAVTAPGAPPLQTALREQMPGWYLTFDQLSGYPSNLAGQPISLPGSTLDQKAATFIQTYLAPHGFGSSTWKNLRNQATAKTHYLAQRQLVNNREVVFSNLTFKFTTNGDLKGIQAKIFPVQDNLQQPAISANTALKSALEGLDDYTLTQRSADEQWVWFPLPTAAGYELRPAYAFSIEGKHQQTHIPAKLYGYVDAVTGTLLFRGNKVQESINLTVKGSVYKTDATQPATQEPLAGLDVILNGTQYYLDNTGSIVNNTINLPATVQLTLQNQWCQVMTDGIPSTLPVFSGTLNSNGTMLFPTTTPSSNRHVNAFYHVTAIHDFMKGKLPSFTGLDAQLPTNVDVTGGTCNAYFDYTAINFFEAGGGCSSFAEIATIVAHEYGHAINAFFYYEQSGQTMMNSALHEATADVWAMALSEDPVIGKGASSNNGLIRRYDLAPKVYPFDLYGEPHADAEILAGAWWDVAVNLGSVPAMSQLFADTYYDLPDGPPGSEGDIYMQVLFAALNQDDNDNDLSNGTPHFGAITAAFAKHGITLMGAINVTHQELTNQPANTPISIKASVVREYPNNFGKVVLYYRNRNLNTAYTPLTMSGSSINFTASIPAQPEGAIIDYYFAVQDPLGYAATTLPERFYPQLPAQQSNTPFQIGVGLKTIDSNLFESNPVGWKIGSVTGDNATSGKWVWALPIGSSSQTLNYNLNCQPGEDFTTGSGRCLVTGNASNALAPITTADVDNGKTTVLSPILDLSSLSDPCISYQRWFSNNRGDNPGNDPWRVQITNDGTTWYNVENTFISDSRWRKHLFKVRDYVTPNATVQLRFIASDSIETLNLMGQSVVEAAIDNFFVYDSYRAPGASVAEHQIAAPLTLYPNPAQESFTVTLPAGFTKGTLRISDVTGRVLQVKTMSGTGNIVVPATSLASGQYIVTLTEGERLYTAQLTIRK
jgi:hypothetical protein